MIKKILTTKLEVGKQVDIISYNAIPIKQIILEGITIIFADFKMMEKKVAKIILERSIRIELFPFIKGNSYNDVKLGQIAICRYRKEQIIQNIYQYCILPILNLLRYKWGHGLHFGHRRNCYIVTKNKLITICNSIS